MASLSSPSLCVWLSHWAYSSSFLPLRPYSGGGRRREGRREGVPFPLPPAKEEGVIIEGKEKEEEEVAETKEEEEEGKEREMVPLTRRRRRRGKE